MESSPAWAKIVYPQERMSSSYRKWTAISINMDGTNSDFFSNFFHTICSPYKGHRASTATLKHLSDHDLDIFFKDINVSRIFRENVEHFGWNECENHSRYTDDDQCSQLKNSPEVITHHFQLHTQQTQFSLLCFRSSDCSMLLFNVAAAIQRLLSIVRYVLLTFWCIVDCC